MRDRWARLMALPKRVLPSASARAQAKGAAAAQNDERPDPKVASACHQLGLIAQSLGHTGAAETWHVEALRTAARLKDYGLCARSAHQLAELCVASERQLEAEGWTALTLASMAVAPGRAERLGLQGGQEAAGRIDAVGLQRLWRDVTGRELPARLRAVLEGWCEKSTNRVLEDTANSPSGRPTARKRAVMTARPPTSEGLPPADPWQS